jgi:FkbM family methyltransferase
VETHILSSGLLLKNAKINLSESVTSIKIDVGLSGNAPQSEIWTEHNENLVVFGFEPISRNREMIKTYTSSWPIKLNPLKLGKSVFVIPVALSSNISTENLKMYITDDDPGCSSLLTPKQLKNTECEYVPVYTLADFFLFFPFDKFKYIDHLKIDAQGMDFEILIGCSRYLKYVSYVTAEVDLNYESSKNSIFFLNIYMFSKGFIKINIILLLVLKKLYNHEILVGDPTYFNIRLFYQNRKNIFIYQQN